MKEIELNDMLIKEIKECFVCGNKKYKDFYCKNAFYRVCKDCLNTKDVINFFKNRDRHFNLHEVRK